MGLAGKDIEAQTGLRYKAMEGGQSFSGSFKRTFETAHAKYAIIENGLNFSLVPWKQGLERLRQRRVQLAMSPGMDISWTRGRSRGLSL